MLVLWQWMQIIRWLCLASRMRWPRTDCPLMENHSKSDHRPPMHSLWKYSNEYPENFETQFLLNFINYFTEDPMEHDSQSDHKYLRFEMKKLSSIKETLARNHQRTSESYSVVVNKQMEGHCWCGEPNCPQLLQMVLHPRAPHSINNMEMIITITIAMMLIGEILIVP